jgi:two-component system, OmpR family, KDP operon response regulator KdpE
MTKVLVVDDEPQIIRALRVNLQARDYDVIIAMNGRQALDVASRDQPDLVVLDLGLPDMDGVDVIRALRGWTSVPILILSGRTQSLAKVQALDAGADDYVTKPFQVDELVARLRAVGRRAATNDGSDEQPIVQIGETTVDLVNHRVTTSGGGEAGESVIRLTKTEWHLLSVLVRNPGRLITQRELMLAIRRPDHDDAAHYLRQYMTQLRRKLEPNPARPRHLLTEPGMGYRFQP